MIELMVNLREVNTKGVSWRTIRRAWGKLQNLHKLRATESLDVIIVDNYSSIDMINLELLDLSGNVHMESLLAMSSTGNLKMLVLDGCSSLEHVALEGSLPLLESFSFEGYGPSEMWRHPIELPKKELRPNSRSVQKSKVRRIALEGCSQLHNMFMRALPNLEELDLSGTTIKTLDLNAMGVPQLKKLFLVDCEKLRSLLWYGSNSSLEVLHVDTQGNNIPVIYCEDQALSVFEAIMVFTDGRFLWSTIKALNINTCFWNFYAPKVRLHISSRIHSQVNMTKNIEEFGPSREVLVPTGHLLPYISIVLNKDTITRSSLLWDHRKLYPLRLHIEIGEGSHHLECMNEDKDFNNFIWGVKSLHVHDNILITTILPGVYSYWVDLEWCHVEMCPKLHTLFSSRGRISHFNSITIFSAYDLLMAYCIWERGIPYESNNFHGLQHIYLHSCPRLVFVLPISFTLPNLETIQIAYCQNLQHIFPLDDDCPQEIAFGVTFEKLKHIKMYHLHKLKHIKMYHLHKLKQICGARLITAPALETASLRECCGLRRLPAVSRQGPKPVVDWEKDWWDRLRWDGPEANHEPSLFETRHSAHYKKTLPRVSILR